MITSRPRSDILASQPRATTNLVAPIGEMPPDDAAFLLIDMVSIRRDASRLAIDRSIVSISSPAASARHWSICALSFSRAFTEISHGEFIFMTEAMRCTTAGLLPGVEPSRRSAASALVSIDASAANTHADENHTTTSLPSTCQGSSESIRAFSESCFFEGCFLG